MDYTTSQIEALINEAAPPIFSNYPVYMQTKVAIPRDPKKFYALETIGTSNENVIYNVSTNNQNEDPLANDNSGGGRVLSAEQPNVSLPAVETWVQLPRKSIRKEHKKLFDILPEQYIYKVTSFRKELLGFSAEVRAMIHDKECALTWLKDFEIRSHTKFRVDRTFPEDSVRVLFKKRFRCRHNTRPNSHKVKTPGKVHTGCNALLCITVKQKDMKRSKDRNLKDFPCRINIRHTHNHPVPSVFDSSKKISGKRVTTSETLDAKDCVDKNDSGDELHEVLSDQSDTDWNTINRRPTRVKQEREDRAAPVSSGFNVALDCGVPVCRLCLGSEEVSCPLFSPESPADENRSVILSAIPVQVKESDGLPQSICQKCYSKLTMWYNFREMCVSTEVILKQYVSNATCTRNKNNIAFHSKVNRNSDIHESNVCGEEPSQNAVFSNASGNNALSIFNEGNIQSSYDFGPESSPLVLSKKGVFRKTLVVPEIANVILTPDDGQQAITAEEDTLANSRDESQSSARKRAATANEEFIIPETLEPPLACDVTDVCDMNSSFVTAENVEMISPSKRIKKSRQSCEEGEAESSGAAVVEICNLDTDSDVNLENYEACDTSNFPDISEFSCSEPGTTLIVDDVKYYILSPPVIGPDGTVIEPLKLIRAGDDDIDTCVT